jgi:hypothetical protein
MADTQAIINIDGTIGLILTPAPGTSISNVQWFQTNPIGNIIPGATPEVATFKPSEPGITGIYVKCEVSIL